MASEFFHARFRLSDLIKAVQKALSVTPTVPAALTYYWNWASARGWRLKAVSNQMDPNQVILSVERSPQLEMRNEEYWNVIWAADDVTDGSPDLVEDMGVSQFPQSLLEREVVGLLGERGWVETVSGEFAKYGYLPIDYSEIVEACRADSSAELIVDGLEVQ
jgi:hypothetical protein